MVKKLPARNKVSTSDTWDLSTLFASDDEWEKSFRKWEREIQKFKPFRGTLGKSAKKLSECLELDLEFDRLGERLGAYAFLKTTEDQTNADYQRMVGRFRSIATKAGEATSFIRPEIMAIPTATMKKFLASSSLAEYKLLLERLRRYRKHTLGEKEEQLLAMQGEMASAAGNIFRKLLDADLKFGSVEDESGNEIELTNATLSQLLQSPKRAVRKKAFHQFYGQFEAHENSLAAALAGSVQKDVYYAKVRGYSGALDRALFPDKVPQSVYDNLIASVRNNLPAVHHYLEVRRRKMKLKKIHMYDTYVPLLPGLRKKTTWKQASDTIIAALQPLGEEYCSVLADGFNGRWCDRYPNRNKQSGAFSYGVYQSVPFIMMNYTPEVLEDMFTLAHEAGHSMHTYLSSANQPFQYYNYTIFVAEVASTFNEELLSHHLLEHADDDKQRAFYINRNIDAIRGTIIRQTMFAEFEKIAHEMVEAGEPLTVASAKDAYGKLLHDYFGPDFVIDEQLQLECLRIPHFYRAFYVYKYATGLSAAIALSRRVLNGGKKEVNQYLGFLKGGCSKYPLDLLKGAGVDMRKPAPVDAALKHFGELVAELDQLV